MENNENGCMAWFFVICFIIGLWNGCSSCTNQTTEQEPPCGITIDYADSLMRADSIAHAHAPICVHNFIYK